MLDDRKRAVLQAIVADYVHRREPVGSEGAGRAAPARRESGDDPQRHGGAGGRGYIAAPHTSAGRIPTDKGYRLFVDQLVTLQPLSSSQRRRHPHLPGRARRPRRRGQANRAAARPADQAAGGGPVPGSRSLHSAARRGSSGEPAPGARRADLGLRGGGAAPGRDQDEIAAEALADVRERLNRVVVGQDYRNLPARLAGFDAELRPGSSGSAGPSPTSSPGGLARS